MNKTDSDHLVRRIVERVQDEIGLAYARRVQVTRFSLEKAVRRTLEEASLIEKRPERLYKERRPGR